jgi:hypothetical protein
MIGRRVSFRPMNYEFFRPFQFFDRTGPQRSQACGRLPSDDVESAALAFSS